MIAALHVHLAEIDAKRGLLKSTERHVVSAENLLKGAVNWWLSAKAANIRLAVHILRSEFDAARQSGVRAIELATRSGALSTLRASLANVGNLMYSLGAFKEATEYFEKSLAILPSSGSKANACRESLARVCLAQDRFDSCGEWLDQIERSIKAESDRVLYGHRYAEFTRARLLERQDRFNDALTQVELVTSHSEQSGDELLSRMTALTRAELRLIASPSRPSVTIFDGLPTPTENDSPELCAQYERLIALGLLVEGRPLEARRHHDRAERICERTKNVPALLELRRLWSRPYLLRLASTGAPVSTVNEGLENPAAAMLQSVASLILHLRRPDVVVDEVQEILKSSSCAESFSVYGEQGGSGKSGPCSQRSFNIASARGSVVEVVATPKPDIDSIATLSALGVLLSSLQELDQARTEREARATLWPVEEELSLEGDQAVVGGHMKELMIYAKRIARTTVNVLITGESGTGKEILAKAIHNFSDRASKPFVPFNCSAIPRDLMESQLFGHRRGAFTGAERDQPGLIRAATGGTLFLDEVGDLSLELQPKLLRFLESGEIAPLGEPAPLRVNVRIVAATNANLEDAVQAGKFREDLF
ncbi:MAG TPA: sigma 54-interacting transcriptional regulator, partial [Vicinamibacterales bacterium]|nr:sigma 54-interacting transcriptional regulator [Vicinamibacterales bacterium]